MVYKTDSHRIAVSTKGDLNKNQMFETVFNKFFSLTSRVELKSIFRWPLLSPENTRCSLLKQLRLKQITHYYKAAIIKNTLS